MPPGNRRSNGIHIAVSRTSIAEEYGGNRCGASTCFSAGRLGDVELGHEFAVGGAGGGEVLVAFFELQP